MKKKRRQYKKSWQSLTQKNRSVRNTKNHVGNKDPLFTL